METFTIALVAIVDDALLAPPRATVPDYDGLHACLAGLPVWAIRLAGPPAFYVQVCGVASPTAHGALVGLVRRRLEDAGYDIAHRNDWRGRAYVAVYAPGAA